jgi:hypothetical protein
MERGLVIHFVGFIQEYFPTKFLSHISHTQLVKRCQRGTEPVYLLLRIVTQFPD